jgi:ABC-type transport system involved in multi-copper enzyme maturation permease subunit
MAFNGLISTFGNRTMPFLAILRHDLRTLRESWLVRIWLVATALVAILLAMSNWAQFPTAPLIASLLFPYLVFPWFLVVMVLGVNPVSGSRLEPLADGFLSRPVTRHEYLLAVWAARVVAVLGVYFLVMVPMVLVVTLANRPVPVDHVTLYGMIAALAVVGLVLTFQVSLAFLLGTLLRRPLLAIVLLVFFWSSVNTVFHTFKLQSFSPLSLSQALPTLLRQPWRSGDANSGSLTSEVDVEELQRQTANFLNVLSGGAPQKTEAKPAFFETTDYKDFSLLRVLLGYGIPTLAAVGLSILCFCWRDL